MKYPKFSKLEWVSIPSVTFPRISNPTVGGPSRYIPGSCVYQSRQIFDIFVSILLKDSDCFLSFKQGLV